MRWLRPIYVAILITAFAADAGAAPARPEGSSGESSVLADARAQQELRW